MKKLIKKLLFYWRLPKNAKREMKLDRKGLPDNGPDIEESIHLAIRWLYLAQDNSFSMDGGVARDYSMISGWSASYPETTGYIIPTMVSYAKKYQKKECINRAKRMLNWLVSIQLPGGGFPGGKINEKPVRPVCFNTGQILMGLACGTKEFGSEYRDAMLNAANWLVDQQDADGSWQKHTSPFALGGSKTYDTHIAWGLLEAARIENESRYADAAVANIKWAMKNQNENGWFEKCCLTDFSQPLTHTIGYTIRGILEGYRFTGDRIMLDAARKTADSLLALLFDNGFLPGRVNNKMKGTVPWSCLTGTVQIAYCWFMLYQYLKDEKYCLAGARANSYVRKTIRMQGEIGLRGGIKGSFPIDGGYGAFQYLNWANKFYIDSNMAELRVQSSKEI